MALLSTVTDGVIAETSIDETVVITTGSGISSLSDVTFTTLNIGDFLQFNGTDWTSGTAVTSVNMSVPTGFAISGTPITTTGTINLDFSAGYQLLNDTTQTIAGSKTFSTAPTFSTMTAGSVLFAGTSGVLAQSNAQLFWDNTNSRLGVGTATPANKLDVIRGTAGAMGRGTYETASFSYDADNKIGMYYAGAAGSGGVSLLFGATNFTASSNYPGFELQFSPSATLASNQMRFNYVNRNSAGTVVSSTADILNIFQGGNVTVGTATNGGFKFDVAGTVRIQNNTTISAGTLTVSALTVNGGVLYTSSTGVVSQSSSLFYSTGLLTLGTGAASQQIKFNYGTTNGGDFTGQLSAVDQMSFGFNNQAVYGGTSAAASGRLIYFYDRVSAVNVAGVSLAGFFIGPSNTNYTFWAERPNASVAAVKITAAGNLLVGTATDSLAKVTTGGSITAATAIARGVYFNNTLVAAANSDVLVGLDVAPTFTNGAFTSVKNYGIRMSGQLNLSSYTSAASYTGTVAGILAFDSSGNILTATNPSAYTVTNQTTTYSVTTTTGTIIVKCDTTTGGFTVTLPTAVGNTATIVIKKTVATNTLTIATTSSQTIDGAASAQLKVDGASVTLISDNANWQII